MKSEERHELKENSLLIWLQVGLPQFLKKNGSYLLLAVALAVLGYQLWNRHQTNAQLAREKATADLLAAEDPRANNRLVKLQNVIDQAESRTTRAIALRDLGNYHLSTINLGKVDLSADAPRVNPDEALKKAADAFSTVVNDYKDVPLAYGGAKLGLATIAENKRNWDEAKKIYEELAKKDAPTGRAFTEVAEYRLKLLPEVVKAPDLASKVPERPTSSPAPDFLRLPSSLVIPPAAGTQPN